jgi:secreted trypsin-like serine protease
MRGIILLLCVASSALAGTTDDGISDARYVEYGATFSTYTARLVVDRGDGVKAGGSCVLVADRWAITAAHVLEDFQGGEIRTAKLTRRVTAVRRHDRYDERAFGNYDIALVHVAEPFALEFYPPIADGSEAVGDTVSIAGYGATGRLSVGHGTADNLLRAGTARIGRLERWLVFCPARSRGTALPICIAPGDSGGPLFANGRLVGIASFTMKDADGTRTRSRAGEDQAFTRVSAYREWIDGVMSAELTPPVASTHGTDVLGPR